MKFPILQDKPLGRCLEGYLFPDTYEIYVHATTTGIVTAMLSNLEKKLSPEIRAEIAAQGKTIFEVLVTASLIEKEVHGKEDKETVAGIIEKRLSAGIPLQLDATVVYLTRKRSTAVSLEELRIDSAYNTYQNTGLPIAPIANPGLESILAVLSPKENPYWYYLSTPDGTTLFSATFQEHSIKKAKYLR